MQLVKVVILVKERRALRVFPVVPVMFLQGRFLLVMTLPNVAIVMSTKFTVQYLEKRPRSEARRVEKPT